jgi:serine/threonine protein kinase/tetratricopeptide (TPR) repeat protein
MNSLLPDSGWRQREAWIAAFEAARAHDPQADLARFLPPAADPLRRDVLRELIRIDLELHGPARRVESYVQRFPELQGDRDGLAAIAFEEYRQRRQAGEAVRPEDYQERLGVTVAGWAAVRSEPRAVLESMEAAVGWPEAGTRFVGFDLLAELGRGAFGRVFLAAQADLAHRFVALKVSTRPCGEPQVLARLQHTNIVPIYSFHRDGPLEAVCMPYLGSTTLSDVLAHLQNHQAPPASGHSLVQTLQERKSRTITPSIEWTRPLRAQEARPQAPAVDVSGSPTPGACQTNATLDMLGHLNHVDAVLWLTARLAEGLAHAHERGILHCDLKPANVLLSDDGQPMLLDFNLAVDTVRRSDGQMAIIGGTPPYMAPEHLELFVGGTRPVDARSDVYALGVVLYELLTCRHLFTVRHGAVDELVPAALAERRTVPAVRRWNRAVTPAVEAIVQHCLEPNPARRYQSAQQLHEDIERQRNHLPLRHASNPSVVERVVKWKRRHPRLTSATAVGIAAVLVVAGLVTAFVLRLHYLAGLEAERARELAHLEAVQTWQQFRTEARLAQRDIYARSGEREDLVKGMAACRQALDRYHVLDNPAWRDQLAVVDLPQETRAQLPEYLGDLLLLSAGGTVLLLAPDADVAARQAAVNKALQYNALAESCYAANEVPRAVWEQRARLYEMLGNGPAARQWRDRAAATPLRTARDFYWCAVDHFLDGRIRDALPLLEEAVRLDPRNFRAWFVLARCHDVAERNADAAACYSTCIALEPEYAWSYFNRGLAHYRQRQYRKAWSDFDKTIALKPQLADAYINRGLAQKELANYHEAIADLTQALQLGSPQTRIYFMRALVWDRLGRRARPMAQADRAEGLKREPTDEKSWIARGLARLPRDPKGALADFDKALQLNPRSVSALQNKAHALDQMPLRRSALPFPLWVGDKLLAVRERLEQTQQAIAALDRALAIAPDYVLARHGRGVLLARLGKRTEALADAQEALKRDTTPLTLYTVACIYALTTKEQPDDRLEAFRLLAAALRQGFGTNLIEIDTDLVALRPYPEFQRLVQMARVLRAVKN